jgi:hypothetical protein
MLSSSRISISDPLGEVPDGSGVSRVIVAALEPSDFSPGASQRKLRELESGFGKLELLCLIFNVEVSSCNRGTELA